MAAAVALGASLSVLAWKERVAPAFAASALFTFAACGYALASTASHRATHSQLRAALIAAVGPRAVSDAPGDPVMLLGRLAADASPAEAGVRLNLEVRSAVVDGRTRPAAGGVLLTVAGDAPSGAGRGVAAGEDRQAARSAQAAGPVPQRRSGRRGSRARAAGNDAGRERQERDARAGDCPGRHRCRVRSGPSRAHSEDRGPLGGRAQRPIGGHRQGHPAGRPGRPRRRDRGAAAGGRHLSRDRDIRRQHRGARRTADGLGAARRPAAGRRRRRRRGGTVRLRVPRRGRLVGRAGDADGRVVPGGQGDRSPGEAVQRHRRLGGRDLRPRPARGVRRRRLADLRRDGRHPGRDAAHPGARAGDVACRQGARRPAGRVGLGRTGALSRERAGVLPRDGGGAAAELRRDTADVRRADRRHGARGGARAGAGSRACRGPGHAPGRVGTRGERPGRRADAVGRRARGGS